jgi:HTH-type transcriptional regulator/antitoxin HigA
MYIIKNDDQKTKTLSRIRDFEAKASEVRKIEGEEAARAFLQVYASHIKDLEQQVREYEKLKRGELPVGSFSDLVELGPYLVKARIVSGLTQDQLAQKLNVSQPMVHKYELSEYAGCGLEILTKAAEAMGIRITLRATAGLLRRRPQSETVGRRAAAGRT